MTHRWKCPRNVDRTVYRALKYDFLTDEQNEALFVKPFASRSGTSIAKDSLCTNTFTACSETVWSLSEASLLNGMRNKVNPKPLFVEYLRLLSQLCFLCGKPLAVHVQHSSIDIALGYKPSYRDGSYFDTLYRTSLRDPSPSSMIMITYPKKDVDSTATLEWLPAELVMYVCQYLDVRSIVRFKQCSKQMHAACGNRPVFKILRLKLPVGLRKYVSGYPRALGASDNDCFTYLMYMKRHRQDLIKMIMLRATRFLDDALFMGLGILRIALDTLFDKRSTGKFKRPSFVSAQHNLQDARFAVEGNVHTWTHILEEETVKLMATSHCNKNTTKLYDMTIAVMARETAGLSRTFEAPKFVHRMMDAAWVKLLGPLMVAITKWNRYCEKHLFKEKPRLCIVPEPLLILAKCVRNLAAGTSAKWLQSAASTRHLAITQIRVQVQFMETLCDNNKKLSKIPKSKRIIPKFAKDYTVSKEWGENPDPFYLCYRVQQCTFTHEGSTCHPVGDKLLFHLCNVWLANVRNGSACVFLTNTIELLMEQLDLLDAGFYVCLGTRQTMREKVRVRYSPTRPGITIRIHIALLTPSKIRSGGIQELRRMLHVLRLVLIRNVVQSGATVEDGLKKDMHENAKEIRRVMRNNGSTCAFRAQEVHAGIVYALLKCISISCAVSRFAQDVLSPSVGKLPTKRVHDAGIKLLSDNPLTEKQSIIVLPMRCAPRWYVVADPPTPAVAELTPAVVD